MADAVIIAAICRDTLEVIHQVEQIRSQELAEGRGMDGLATPEPSAAVSTWQSSGIKNKNIEMWYSLI